MKRITITKRIIAFTLCLIMMFAVLPTAIFADGTYTFPSLSQSGDNNSTLRYYLTDENAGVITINERTDLVQFYLDMDEGWYFERWDTYFDGYKDRPILSDPEVNGSNPVNDEGFYTFYNINGTQRPFENLPGTDGRKFIYIAKGTGFYGDHRITAVLKPIVTVDADVGVSYIVTTNNPTAVSANQTAVKYKDDVKITYTIDNKYVVTTVGASGTKDISIDKDNSIVTLNDTEKPTSVGIYARLKQQNVNFNANGGNGTMTTQVFEHSVEQVLTANSFTKEGYTFNGWNTESDGSGTGYIDSQTAIFTPANDGDSITLYAQWEREPYVPCDYTVSFNANGGEDISPITVTYGEKYGKLPSSAITGFSGGDSNWYLVDESGNVTDTKITNLSEVMQMSDHTLFIKRKVLAPTVSIALTVPGGISDGYQYYIPGNSQRVLTATISNKNTQFLDYTYQWYKEGALIEGAITETLTLDGNVSDSGNYKVNVTATLKNGSNIIVTSDSASTEKEKDVKILHATNTLEYDANGGENGPSSSYTGGATLTIANNQPKQEGKVFVGWNTKADGTGDDYSCGSVYTFAEDNGNGGCKVILYAQWKTKEYNVIYKANNEVIATDLVEHGGDVQLPSIPEKEGYIGTWDHDGKTITADTVINAVYTINEYTITFMDENGIYKTFTYKHGETVTMPDAPVKEGYTVEWETTIDKATGNATIKAVYTKVPMTDVPCSPQTADNNNLWLWVALAFVSIGLLFGALFGKKRKRL